MTAAQDPNELFDVVTWDGKPTGIQKRRINAPIGVPGTSLTNWPDEFIHSTGDDLEQIDATQLERNAVVVAGVALYFAGLRLRWFLGAAVLILPTLAAYVWSASYRRDRIFAFSQDDPNGEVTKIQDFLPNSALTAAGMPIWDNVIDFDLKSK